jgi:hypothetical protein
VRYGELEEDRAVQAEGRTPPVVAEVKRAQSLVTDLAKARTRLTERLAHVTAQRPKAVEDADKRPNDAQSETGQALARSNDELANEIRLLIDLTDALEV